MGSADFIESVGEDGAGIYITSTATPKGPTHDKLVAEFNKQFGNVPSHHAYAYAYDAATMLLSTIETVAEQDPDGTLHIGRQALRNALYDTTDFNGITGWLTCNKCGDCGAGNLVILRLDAPSAGLEGLRSNVIYTD